MQRLTTSQVVLDYHSSRTLTKKQINLIEDAVASAVANMDSTKACAVRGFLVELVHNDLIKSTEDLENTANTFCDGWDSARGRWN